MTKSNVTTEQNLKAVLSNALKNSSKEIKNQSSDINKMNVACVPYIQEQMKQGSNIKWTISEIQNKMKELVEYAPQDKDDRNPAFEMRVLASAEQIVLKLERVNPNAFGEYDSKGNWQDHNAETKTTNSKNYNVKFNDVENGFDFNEKGELVISNKFILPVIENDVKVSDNVTKKEKFANQTTTKQVVSKALATGFFKRAYPQAKKSRATKPLTENEHIENAEKLTKYINDINVIYSDYVKSGGKNGNADRLSEKDAKVFFKLSNAIDEMNTSRGNAEELAHEIEEGLKRRQA
tara:strand:- start:81 stop:959 length:879 start_codon:yes stop_codon:yes gene_type:complete